YAFGGRPWLQVGRASSKAPRSSLVGYACPFTYLLTGITPTSHCSGNSRNPILISVPAGSCFGAGQPSAARQVSAPTSVGTWARANHHGGITPQLLRKSFLGLTQLTVLWVGLWQQ